MHLRLVRFWLRLGMVGLAMAMAVAIAPRVLGVVSEDALPSQAQWMSADDTRQPGGAQFRRSFWVEAGIAKAVMLVAADQRAVLFVNGTNAGTAVGFQRALTLDVTRWIRPGTNVLAIQATNAAGPAAVEVMLELAMADGRQRWVVSDASWQTTRQAESGWTQPDFLAANWRPAFLVPEAAAQRYGNPFGATKSADAYNSWMLARGATQATDPATFSVRPGFRVERLRSAAPEEDSWIALAFDPQGRLTVAREQRGLLRMTLGADQVTGVEVIEDTLLECRGLLYAHGGLYVNANNSRGLYRLRDLDGDGKFEDKKLLLATEGGVGHGRNQLRLGPDGLIYILHGDDVVLPKNLAPDSPVQQMANDQMMPTLNPGPAAQVSRYLQVGHVLQTDKDGSFFRLVAGGLRNPMDLAFNEDGEMFTYEADMERDIGAPWYLPTRILHLVPGGDYGWRRGRANLPTYSPEVLPSVVDIGVGSPTGVAFGLESRFPEPYRHAFFVGDWAYGRILAVFLKPDGASYRGKWEDFLSGRPLNVTDLTFGPDGALYFVTGGRGTKSGLYRVTYVGDSKATADPAGTSEVAAKARAVRRHLEQEVAPSPERLEEIWSQLGSSDRWIRSAARRALERTPIASWSGRAMSETNPAVASTALLALSRVASKEAQPLILQRLGALPLGRLSEADRLAVLRTYAIELVRFGWPEEAVVKAIRQQLLAIYPTGQEALNRELARVLIHLRAPEALAKTLPLLSGATDSADRLYYLLALWAVRDGWSLDDWRTYFTAMRRADDDHGARDYYETLRFLRGSLTNRMGSGERLALADLILSPTNRPNAILLPSGPVVKAWTLGDFNLGAAASGSAQEGAEVFRTAGCVQCHRVGTEGGLIGPDLTAVAARFGTRDLLDHILNPSKAIDEKYRQAILTLKDGSVVTGTVERDDDPVVIQVPEPGVAPREIPKAQIQDRRWSDVSPMPTGLLDRLTQAQVLDLLAFLEAAR